VSNVFKVRVAVVTYDDLLSSYFLVTRCSKDIRGQAFFLGPHFCIFVFNFQCVTILCCYFCIVQVTFKLSLPFFKCFGSKLLALFGKGF
jgi:hypothetical protein